MNWYVEVLKKYAVFTGRAHRAEFWFFVLFYILIAIGLSVVETILGLPALLSTLYGLAMLIPSLAVCVRRLHDTGRTGLWVLIGFIPLVGFIVLLIFTVMDSQPGTNEYGPNPKEATT